MQKKGRLKKNLIISFGCAVICCISAVLFNSFKKVDVVAEIIGDTPLLTQYIVEDKIVVPNREIVYEGKNYSTEWYIEQPSGKRIHSTEVVLKEGGQYSLVYYVDLEGKRIKATHDFFVASKLYDVSSTRSSFYYGESAYEGVSGVNVSLVAGDNFTYNKVVDISQFGVLDDIVSLVITPQTLGFSDAEKIHITLTDAYDKDNYVVISVKQNVDSTTSWYRTCYVTANAGEIQLPAGIEKADTKIACEIDGETYQVFVNNVFGTYFHYSMTGTFQDVNEKVGVETLGVSLDSATSRVYVNNGKTSPKIVTQLNHPDIYTNTWKGFTTGEVFVSINATNYNEAALNFTLKKIAGEVLTEDNQLTRQAPEIVVDCPDIVPNAIVGRSYPIFDAIATNAYDNQPQMGVRVYYNYDNDATRFEVDVKNGRFATNLSGVYSIVYKAKDCYGNVSLKEVKVACIETDEILALSLQDGYATEMKVKETIKLADYTVASYYGDEYEVNVQARLVGSDVVYDIGDDLLFAPSKSGNYEITYTCNDISDEKVASYQISVFPNPNPVLDDCYFPKYVIKNATYSFPKVYADDFSEGIPQRMGAATLEIAEYRGDKLERKTVADDKYTVGDCDYIVATYTAQTKTGKASCDYKATVVDVGYGDKLDLSRYFYEKEQKFEATRNLLNISFVTDVEKTNGEENAELEFINSLTSRQFEIRLIGLAEKQNFEKLTIKLTGINGEVLKLSYSPQGADTVFYINDVSVGKLGSNFFDALHTFSLKYDEISKTVSPINGKVFDIRQFFDSFEGLGNKLTFTIALEGISGEAGFMITRVCNQVMGNSATDVFAPVIDQCPITGYIEKETVITIVGVNILDVLDSYVEYTFNVYCPDGSSYAKDVNGVLLQNVDPSIDYQILLDECGGWSVEYTAKDSNGKSINYSYVINVPDSIPPMLEISGGDRTGKVGEMIKLAEATTSDTMGEVTLNVIVKDNDGRYHIVTERYIICNSVGTYTVYYYAMDEGGNISTVQYDILVEA